MNVTADISNLLDELAQLPTKSLVVAATQLYLTHDQPAIRRTTAHNAHDDNKTLSSFKDTITQALAAGYTKREVEQMIEDGDPLHVWIIIRYDIYDAPFLQWQRIGPYRNRQLRDENITSIKDRHKLIV